MAYNGRVYFAGGLLTDNFNGAYSNKVSYVDLATGTTGFLSGGLSVGRAGISCAAYDGKLYFAGGYKGTSTLAPYITCYDVVEIYDVINGMWLPSKKLSVAKGFGAVAVVKGKIMFAGGYYIVGNDAPSSDVVDILDPTTGDWLPVQHLSQGRNDFQAAVIGNKVWFCGGVVDFWSTIPSNRVDIYDADLDKWTIDSLSQAREGAAVVANGQYIICAGGASYPEPYSDRVDIYDTQSPNDPWTTATLPAPRYGIAAATLGNKSYFTGGGRWNFTTYYFDQTTNTVDVFDASAGLTNAWSTQTLKKNRMTHSCSSWGNKIAVGGGWRAEQSQVTGSVEILTDSSFVSVKNALPEASFDLSPNPASDVLTLSFFENKTAAVLSSLSVFDFSGKAILKKQLDATDPKQPVTLDLSGLQNGVYSVQIETDGQKSRAVRFVVMR